MVLAILVGLRPVSAQSLSGLQAWWTFEQGNSSTVSDASGQGNQGQLIGYFGWRSGIQGQALEFRGRDYMDAGRLPGLGTQHLTLAAFLWVDHAGDPMWIASKGRKSESFWGLQILADGRLRFHATWRDSLTRQGQWESQRTILPNQWTHVAVTYDGAGIQFYLDGRAESIAAQFTYNQGSVLDQALLLGTSYGESHQYFDGMMDEVRLYNRVLSASEIRGLSATIGRAADPVPEDGAQGVKQPVLSWTPSADAARQRVYLGEQADRLALVAELGARDSDHLLGGGLALSQRYYWRVDSIGASGQVSPGDLWSFVTLGLSAESPDPAHGARLLPLQPLLSWTPGVYSSLYSQVYFGTDQQAVENADETWPQYQGRFDALQPFFDPGQLQEGSRYFWRVDGVGFGNTLYRGEVWHFSTQSSASSPDPDLSLWWKLDEGSGDTAQDASRMNRHGQIHQGNWVEGHWAQGIEFDSRSTYIALSEVPVAQNRDVTISVWIYPYSQRHERVIAWWNGRGLWLTDDRVVLSWDGQHRAALVGDITDEWTHLCLTARGNFPGTLYLNGNQRFLSSDGTRFPTSVTQSGFTLGNTEPAWGAHFFDGIMDDLRAYSRVLASHEISGLLGGGERMASSPEPGHGAEIDLGQVRQLKWQPDSMAHDHDVYLGPDRQAVDTATPDSSDVYLGQTRNASMSLPPGLNTGRTYHWRVDELQGDTITQGVTWRFSTARIRTIDGFEEYKPTSPMRIFETWIDGQGAPGFEGNGTGAYVGHELPPHYETELVHGGYQSMPLYYDNTGVALFSEANRSFSTPQDWASGNMRSLVLYYRGDPTNTLGPQDRLYLAVKDVQGHEQVWVCSHRATLLQRARWHRWKIDLDQISQLGINLRAITRISIGVGNRAQPLAGGTGLIFMDDLGLSSLEG